MEKEIKDDLFIPKTKHKGLKIILAIFLIVALGIGGYFIYQEKFNNPNATVISVLEKMQKNTNNLFNEKDEGKYKINGLVKVDTTLPNELKELANIIRNIDLQFNGEIDYKNSIGNISLNSKYKNEKLLDIKSYFENNTIYLLLDGLFDKYLKYSLSDVTKEQNNIQIPEIDINTKDIKVIYESLIKAIKNSLNKLEFIRKNEKILIDEKEYDVNNNYTILKGNDIKKLITNIIHCLSKDNDFTSTLKRITSTDTKNIFDKITKNISEQELKETIKINFYTKGLLEQKAVSIRLEFVNDDTKALLAIDTINSNEEVISFKTTGTEVTIKVKKTNSIANLNLIANITGITVKIDINTNFEKIKEITKPDLTNSVDINNLTEKESNDVNEKLKENKTLQELLKDIAETNIIQE